MWALAGRLTHYSMFLLPAVAAVMGYVLEDAHSTILLLLAWLAVGLIAAPTGLTMAYRNRQAELAVANGRPFCLYLRSFRLDTSAVRYQLEHVMTSVPVIGWFLGRRGWGGEDLQRILWNAAPGLPTIAIGDKVTRYGVVKLRTSDGTWEAAAQDLMNRATVIVFAPYPTPGTMKELDWLLSRHVGKTLVIMPPTISARRADLARSWEQLRAEVADRVTLPSFRGEGAIFTLVRQAAAGGSFAATTPKTLKWRNLRDALRSKTRLPFAPWHRFRWPMLLTVFALSKEIGGTLPVYQVSAAHAANTITTAVWSRFADRRRPVPGDVFSDCRYCPEMVVVPAGEFQVGVEPAVAKSQLYAYGEERAAFITPSPKRPAHIERPFAVGKFPLMTREWNLCVRAGGCNKWHDATMDRSAGLRPRESLSWNEAVTYVTWLSRFTGQRYRVISEPEWEYVARAGSDVDLIADGGFLASNRVCGGCSDRLDPNYDRYVLMPVGSSPPNALGLHDLFGLSYGAWTRDCVDDIGTWDLSHPFADGCPARVVRGQGLEDRLQLVWRAIKDNGSFHMLRVVRDLKPSP